MILSTPERSLDLRSRIGSIARRLAGLALLLASANARAERLAFRSFGVPEGLAHPRISSLACDARGFLWVGTWEGLCRFDGRRFERYGPREGLAKPIVDDVAEDAQGRVWFATHGAGVARFAGDSGSAEVARPGFAETDRPRFVCALPADSVGAGVVSSIAFDGEGRLWCATEAGFFRAEIDAAGEPRFEATGFGRPGPRWKVCAVDGEGAAVLFTEDELARSIGGELARFSRPLDAEGGDLVGVARLDASHFAVAHERALFECELPRDPRSAPRWRRLDLALAPDARVTALALGAQGDLWIGTTRGLIHSTSAGSRAISIAEGLADEQVRALCVDARGALWIGGLQAGLQRLGESALVRYEASAVPGPLALARVLETPAGEIYATSNDRGLFRLVGSELERVPGSERAPFAEAHVRALCDAESTWWFGTELGLYRVPGEVPRFAEARRVWPVEGAGPRAVFSEPREEPRGAIAFTALDGALVRLERGADGSFEARESTLPEGVARSPVRTSLVLRNGDEWLGTFDELLRRRGERYERLDGRSGLPAPAVRPRALLVDGRGRLWLGLRFEGVRACDEPEADEPRFRAWTSADGLPSDAVWSLAEDARGRVYAGTGRGLARFDPESGVWRRFGGERGFGSEVVNHVLCDSAGRAWAATAGGLLRVDPELEALDPPAPPCFVEAIALAGRALALPARGAKRVLGLVVEPGLDDLVLEYAAPSLGEGDELRYEHRLVGEDPEWSAPSERSAVQYASLAPGSHRFEVRAVSASGEAGEPAVVELEVLAPVWRRAWFLALAGAVLAGVVYALHRARLRRVLALERVRTQIATDLHDDLGSGLAQIAILSEVARRDADAEHASTFGEIAGLARGLRESMAEIVWAIDPRRDKLLDLVRRMRQVAANLLEAEGVEVEFDAPPDERLNAVGLSPEERRQLLLVFKEAVTNVARHAEATRVSVSIELAARRLRLTVEDDGRGFDPGERTEGHGLHGSRMRAEATNGEFEVRSVPGEGTRVRVEVALGREG